jgi:hypothetical protein
MDAGRRGRVRTGICVALPALVLALWAAVGLRVTAGAHPAPVRHGPAVAALVPHRAAHAVVRVQDPVGFDLAPAGRASVASPPAGPAAVPDAPAHLSVDRIGDHNRGPPGAELD